MSQIAVSSAAIAWSASPRSRRMSLVDGSIARHAPSGSVAERPRIAGASSSWMIPTMTSCSASVSPLYDSETTPSAVCMRTTIVQQFTME